MFSEKTKERKTILDIFQTMAYNENQVENFTSILSWVESQENETLSSVVNGKWIGGPTSGESRFETFKFKKTEITISYFPSKFLKDVFLEISQDAPPLPIEKDERLKRMQKFREILVEKEKEICCAESIASQIPLWEVEAFDLPKWKNQIGMANESTIPTLPTFSTGEDPGKKLILIQLSRCRQGFSTTTRLLELLGFLVLTDEKICLIMTIASRNDVQCYLPAIYLIEVANKQKIRKAPIDLLLLDYSSKEHMNLLKDYSHRIMIWGSGDFTSSNSLQSSSFSCKLFSGVFTSTLEGRIERGVHYVIDSSADSQTAVCSIVNDLWVSGTKVNTRNRALLFIHQSKYEEVILLFEKRIAQLKIGELGSRISDFIQRNWPSGLNSHQIEEEGIKTIPKDSDFSTPTLLYDVGTSSEVLTNVVAGNGHLLFVIPYRTIVEFLSLANNYGEKNEMSLFTSDMSSISQIARSVKTTDGIWVNSLPQEKQTGNQLKQLRGTEDMRNWTFLVPSELKTLTIQPLPPQNLSLEKTTEFRKALLLAEKSRKNWSSMGNETRVSTTVQILRTALKADPTISESDTLTSFDVLMRVARSIGDEERPEGSLNAFYRQPLGIIGIMLINSSDKRMSRPTTFLPILMAAMKGNAVLVVAVGEEAIPSSRTGVIACNTYFPSGVGQFLHVRTIHEGLNLLAQEGNVPVVWIIHPGMDIPNLENAPKNAFSYLLVDSVSSIEKTFEARAKLLEIFIPVHF